jgi:signal transduction histidine kinase
MSGIIPKDLRTISTLSDLDDDLIQWIIDNSTYRDFEDGELIWKTGEPAEYMIFNFDGGVDFFMEQGGKYTYVRRWGHEISGLLPFSRMTHSPGNAYAVGKTRALFLHKDHFGELEKRSPLLTERLVNILTDRSRFFATLNQQKEKMSALGKIAAGIAHELNNPSAAIIRSAKELSKKILLLPQLTEALIVNRVSCKNFDLMVKKISEKPKDESISFAEQDELENEIRGWLDEKKIENSWQLAFTFASAGITKNDLEGTLQDCRQEQVDSVLQWLDLFISFHLLAREIEFSSGHISQLVSAVKSHSNLDRGQERQPADIHEGINNTLTILNHKLRKKNISVNKDYEKALPQVPVFVTEINQVWLNLLDNAIDAMDAGGELKIKTANNGAGIKVHIADNGPGIPLEYHTRIFDPFFTTKPVGEGTGLGLDMVKKIIEKHKASISFTSKPGDTEFIVQLPLA